MIIGAIVGALFGITLASAILRMVARWSEIEVTTAAWYGIVAAASLAGVGLSVVLAPFLVLGQVLAAIGVIGVHSALVRWASRCSFLRSLAVAVAASLVGILTTGVVVLVGALVFVRKW